ncbi:PREDICTED: zinc finger protein 706-like [Chrysochloris asiatica]|uniref:Zinc finger protein 706 n=1 Tax=Chrysochloris asiatica TaxID=185453 RepID=A0A9B0T2I1_CHRAS|nr:PREDICTED: zinc finger protein 706-like [Chrysochloris asiatica]
MAHGQKIQSQQKNVEKQAGQKKEQGHDHKAAAKAALIYTCIVCRTQMPHPKTFKQHFESKHPKTPLPPELADVQHKVFTEISQFHPFLSPIIRPPAPPARRSPSPNRKAFCATSGRVHFQPWKRVAAGLPPAAKS